MKNAFVKTLVIAAGLAGAVQANAGAGATNGWQNGVSINGVSVNGWQNGNGQMNGWNNGIDSTNGLDHSNGLDPRNDQNPRLPLGNSAESQKAPASRLPSLRELASQPLAR